MSYETKKVTSTQITIETVHVTCDICGNRDERADRSKFDGEVNWGTVNYEFSETSVSFRHGTCYPEGGDWNLVSFDICPKCFQEKLRPALEAMGAKPHIEDGNNW